jgi:multidrug efflux system membrane fusion protein
MWSLVVALAAAAWLASGQVWPGDGGDRGRAVRAGKTEAEERQGPRRPPFRVEVMAARVEAWRPVLSLSGHTEASQRLMVRARTAGQVLTTPRREGERVRPGDLLCRLDAADRPARLAAARAALASAEHELKAGKRLFARGHVPESRLRQLEALHRAALAQVRQLEEEMSRLEITSPIPGVLARQLARIGDVLAPGGPCAEVVRLDPLKVVATASEREVAEIRTGMAAMAELVDGRRLSGRISYVAPRADAATRTFRVEMTAANPGPAARAGMTARLVIRLAPRQAALVPLSALVLNDAGEVGLHVVGDDRQVRFLKVDVLAEGREGARVAGIEDGALVIVSGQYYVVPGQQVAPVPFRAPAGE